MDKLKEMQAFAEVAQHGSFVAAAENMRTSKAAVSRYVSELEQRLGCRLMHRTTRRLSLTDEGRFFLLQCNAVLSQIKDAEDELANQQVQVSGLIRISAPVSFGVLHLAPLWGQFMAAHPKVLLDVTLSDRAVDLVEEGFDLAVRIGHLASSSLIHKKLATTRMVLCASPSYLEGKTPINKPQDISDHTVIGYTYLASGDEWHFQSLTDQVRVKTNPRIKTNNGDTCKAAALAHQGVILQPTFIVLQELTAGRLVELIPDYKAASFGIYAVYPSRDHLSSKVRSMVDFLHDAFKTAPW